MDTQANQTCGCQTNGLAILPVRYTVVPNYVDSPMPNWANLSSIVSIPLAKNYQYHVRTLREGFLYIYLPNMIGDNKWLIYSINNEGRLIKQFNNLMAKPIDSNDDNFYCPNISNKSPSHLFFTVDDPIDLDKGYIAYSDFKWSMKTLKKYELNPSQRMQEIDFAQWSGKAESAIAATKENIESILDFNPNFNREKLPYDQNKLITFDKDNKDGQNGFIFNEVLSDGRENSYQFKSELLDLNSTCEPWCLILPENNEYLAYIMQRHTPDNIPMILAIADPVGITTELNGYYNDPYTRIIQYQQERKLEFDALTFIAQAKALVIQKEVADDYSFPNTKNPYIKKIMASGEIPNKQQWPMTCTSKGLDVLIREELYGKPKSLKYYSQFTRHRLQDPNYMSSGSMYLNESVYEKIIRKEQSTRGIPSTGNEEITNNQKNLVTEFKNTLERYNSDKAELTQKRKSSIAEELKKYDKLVNTKPFEEKRDQLFNLVAKKYQTRAKQLIAWIKDSSFYATIYNDIDGNDWDSLYSSNNKKLNKLIDKHEKLLQESLASGEIEQEDLEELRKVNLQGILFSQLIEKVVKGLELSELGKDFLNQMIDLKYAKPADDSVNCMLWRMLTYHSDNILSLFEKIISEAQQEKSTTFTESDIEQQQSRLAKLPYNKIALYFKKLQDVILTIEEIKEHDKNNTIKTNIGILKITQFGMIDKKGIFIMNKFQPIFDKLGNALYSVSTLMFKGLALATAGVSKGSIFCYLQLEYQFLSALISLDKGPNLGTTDLPLYHNRWNLRTKAAIEKTRLLLNDAIARMDNKITLGVKRIFPQAKVNKLFYLGFKASEGDIGISKKMAGTLKSMRIAVVVAMLELYNFNSISKSNPSLDKDEWFSTLKMSAGFALASAGVEVLAMVTAVSKGTRNVIYGLGKALSGVLGGIASLFTTWHALDRADEAESNENNGIARLLRTSAFTGFISGVSSTLAAFSYHFVWCRSLLTTRTMFAIIKRLGTAVFVRRIASFAALRMVLFRVAGLFGVISLVFEIVASLVTDNNLETWLKRCGLRTDKRLMLHNKIRIYKTPQEQRDAFNQEVLKDMFNIEIPKESESNDITTQEQTDTSDQEESESNDITSQQQTDTLNQEESESNDITPQQQTDTLNQEESESNDAITLTEALALVEQDIDERGLLYV